MPERLDYGTLGEATTTPQGGLAIPAHLTRAGVFTYYRDGQPVREWRPMAEVSRPATLDSLRNATLTVGHPKEGRVTTDNYRRLAVGHVGTDVRMDTDKTAATVYVQDKSGLDAIKRGWRDLSCGYNCDTKDTPGTVPAGEPDAGQSYDRVQTNILYNHQAIVPHGRAGTARLHLDAADNVADITEDSMADAKKIETIGGIEYEVGTPAHGDARTRADAADKALKAEVAALRADAAESKGKLAALESEAAGYRKERQDAADAAARVELVGKAAIVLGKDWKADGKDAAAITAEIVAKQFPDVRLDAVPEAERAGYVKGLLAGIKAPAATRSDAAPKGKHVPQPRPFPGAPRSPAAQIRLDSMAESDGMCSRPMAISRQKSQPFLQPTTAENQR
jgi:hypothetical protein